MRKPTIAPARARRSRRRSPSLRNTPVEVHAYPRELAALVASRWPDIVAHSGTDEHGRGASEPALPGVATLERLLSVCYQASLLQEEERPTTFRLALAKPGVFAAESQAPGALDRLVFAQPRPLDQHELRRLAPAASFHHSIIGARVGPRDALLIWGIIHSGPRWLQSVRGGRDIQQVIPPALMLAVTGPGRVLVSKGMVTIGELSGGTVAALAMDVFQARWMHTLFRQVRDAHQAAHLAASARASVAWAALDPRFGVLLAQHALRRVVATIRGARHGGTLVLVPSGDDADALVAARALSVKYLFRDGTPRRRIGALIVQIMNRLAELHAGARPGPRVGWEAYQVSTDPQLAVLDEALFEGAHLAAALADVDGAVLLTRGLEVMGFGGEISGGLAEVPAVARALDLEGTRRQWMRTDREGTRHRSAYRLCQAHRRVVVVVISRDGGLRFVRWHRDAVTYWDQIATGPWEV